MLFQLAEVKELSKEEMKEYRKSICLLKILLISPGFQKSKLVGTPLNPLKGTWSQQIEQIHNSNSPFRGLGG